MTPANQFLALGITFLGCGAVFLAVGIAANMIVFWSMAPAFIVIATVFLVKSRQK